MASKRKRRVPQPASTGSQPEADPGPATSLPPGALPRADAPSVGAGRWRAHLVVLAFLGLQLGVPLSYYLGDDVYDERFAWRMFSPIRMVKCEVRFSEDGDAAQAIPLGREVGETWINWMQRGHRRVIDGYARFHCAEERADGEAPRLYAEVACRLPDGAVDRLYSPREELCAAR